MIFGKQDAKGSMDLKCLRFMDLKCILKLSNALERIFIKTYVTDQNVQIETETLCDAFSSFDLESLSARFLLHTKHYHC